MEYCPLTLKDVISNFYQVSVSNSNDNFQLKRYIACELLYEILQGVSYLHENEKKIIHRDLKPENILISYGESGKFIKIADFGQATYHNFDNQSHTMNRGTDGYRAPEVKMNKKYDTRADLYSLGLIVLELFNIDLNNPDAG